MDLGKFNKVIIRDYCLVDERKLKEENFGYSEIYTALENGWKTEHRTTANREYCSLCGEFIKGEHHCTGEQVVSTEELNAIVEKVMQKEDVEVRTYRTKLLVIEF